ncbi:hypothetical protein LTS07_003998 [Exophiala sideris]|uniref:Negative acting factor n=1 Tax=Exophiala sideris TaxID=1016849 RepID=A0ABR0JDV3_9EURO|nr:hypothetical protein LTS07_003998 [Exophiala sideris]KAK5037231.1 hypothetical protein LTR13_005037 [Exophiala sideris]KAK5062114.1 hypothetical protein LTR69_004471 [Exophiala sideris]KAK5182389.1 hypothetical protein LTR44_005401 [Eurotiomycetes sp. CCFEE 6388]
MSWVSRPRRATHSAVSTSGPSTSSSAAPEASQSRQRESARSISHSQSLGAPIVPPQQNFCDQAVCLFFHQYIIASTNGGNPGFLDFLPELYALSDTEDALSQAVKAVSYITLSGQSSVKILSDKGHEHYRTTLQRITQMLQTPESAAQDSLIIAIMLVVLFENVTYEKPAVMMSHAKGLHTLLLHRGVGQFTSPQSRAIFRHVNSHTQVRNIELSEYPSPETEQWLQGLDMSSPTAGSISEKYRIANVRAAAKEALSHPHNTRDIEARLLEILQEARELDADVARWARELPPSCGYHVWRLDANGDAEQIIEVPDITAAPPGFMQDSAQRMLTYVDVWFASLWAGHRTSRLMLNETMLRIARRLNLPYAQQDATTIMQEMCTETCASIPFSLGDIQVRTDGMGREVLEMNIDSRTKKGAGAGAYFVVWSLRHVVSCEFASEAQVQSASEALVRVGAQYGIKQALTLANRQYQCHPGATNR